MPKREERKALPASRSNLHICVVYCNEEEVFAKCISTLRHERMHVTQLIKGEFRTKTPDELEFTAYSEKLLPDFALPALSDAMWEAAWKKADDHYGS